MVNELELTWVLNECNFTLVLLSNLSIKTHRRDICQYFVVMPLCPQALRGSKCEHFNSMFFFLLLGTTVKVHVVHLEKEKVDPYVNVRPLLSSTVGDLCDLIHEVRTVSFSMQVSGFSYLQETLYITHWSILWFVSWQLSLLASKNAMVIILSTSSQAPFTGSWEKVAWPGWGGGVGTPSPFIFSPFLFSFFCLVPILSKQHFERFKNRLLHKMLCTCFTVI